MPRFSASDAHLIVTIHNYSPLRFTHQGASWVGDPAVNSWIGTTCCDATQRAEIVGALDRAVAWAAGRWPLWLGEFGSHEPTPYASRVNHARTNQSLLRAPHPTARTNSRQSTAIGNRR